MLPFLKAWSTVVLQCVLVSIIQKSESVTCIYMSPLPSHLSHYRELGRVPCAIKQVLICCLLYI